MLNLSWDYFSEIPQELHSSFRDYLIDCLFDKDDKIPVGDVRAYDLSLDFWVPVYLNIIHYESVEYPKGFYFRLCTLFKIDFVGMIPDQDFKYWSADALFHLSIFRSVLIEYTGIENTVQLDWILTWFISPPDLTFKGFSLLTFLQRLYSFYVDYSKDGISHPYRIAVKIERRKEQQKFSQYKRDTTRKKYIEWDSRLTDRFFREADFIQYPDLMLDRIVLQVYSEEFMTWKKDINKKVSSGRVDFLKDAVAESRNYDISLLKKEFGKTDTDEYQKLFRNDYDSRFDLMETRSITQSLQLANQPKVINKTKSGGSLSYYFYEDGCTYWFIASPATKGGPLSLMVSANMLIRVFKKLSEIHPKIIIDYEEEFLKDPNFIPMGWEKEYQVCEQAVLLELQNKALSVYALMLERLGFSKELISNSILIYNINQVEVCWNNPLPLDPIQYMIDIMQHLESRGFHASSLDDKTPMLVTKYISDIEPSVVRFKHKTYIKTKRNLRQELQFFGELKHPCSFWIPGQKIVSEDSTLISDQFFINSDRIKKYLYAKAQLHIIRRTQGFPDAPESFDKEAFLHGYKWYSEKASEPLDNEDRTHLLRLLLADSDLPELFKDFEFFHSFVFRLKSDGYITRKFFTPKTGMGWSNTIFETNIVNSPYFEKMSRGKYRLVSNHHKKRACYFQDFVDKYINYLKQWSIV